MTPAEVTEFRTTFFRRLTLGPLEPTDPQYVPLYELEELRNDDPVELLRFAIDTNPTPTAQLVSGFRGTGKSTELRRLRKVLRDSGHTVLLCDIEDYLNTGQALDPVDFLYAFVLAVSGAAVESVGDDPLREGYLTRLKNFLTRTQVEAPELTAGVKATGDVGAVKAEATAGLKLVLKDNPSFKERARDRWKGSLGSLAAEAHAYIRELAATLTKGSDPKRRVVIIIDSIEHIQGTLDDAAKVQASIEKMFTVHSDLLHFPGVDTVYTVHPYLKIKYANIDDFFPFGGLQIIPTLKVRERGDPTKPGELGAPRKNALDAIARVVEQRGDWWHLLGSGDEGRERLDTLILASGGHLRDLIRLLAEIVRRTRDLPATPAVFDAAVNHVRNQALPIADDDAEWLAEIARSHTTCLPSENKVPSLARFLDTHRVLCYRNGNEWFDVHPLIRAAVLEQAAAVKARKAQAKAT
ncbi:MAG: hypothetical protein R3A52_10600 [Polyangiales bacterium]